MNVLLQKLKEVLYSVVPITVIVLILHFTFTPLETYLLIRFLIGAVVIVLGLSIFLFGVDIGITPLGKMMGSHLTKTNSLWIVAIGSLLLGFFISVAEPDLHVLARSVNNVTSGGISLWSLVLIVSAGIAIMLALGMIRIVVNIPLYKLLTGIYAVIMVLGFFTTPEFLAISFDASGATTGALTVPFILALSIGVSALNKDSKASEKDSFGLIGVTSTGAILGVMIMSLFIRGSELSSSLNPSAETKEIIGPYLRIIPRMALDTLLALLPILLMFIISQFIFFKLSGKAFRRISKGLLYTFIGLTLFMSGVNAGFMDVGSILGYQLASIGNNFLVIITGFILGLVTILAEPAVHVLTEQIEDITSGYVKRKLVLAALSLGVGLAVALAMLKIIVPGIQIWHYLLPGYIISIALTFITPKLFVGIAFDSGGVASGPMTATFILTFAQGAAEKIESANVLIDGFGVIAMVALTPLIALQVLGLIFKAKSRKGGLDYHDSLS